MDKRVNLAMRLFKWLVTTTWFVILAAAVLLGASIAFSIHTGQWQWFQRSGSLVVMAGAVLSTRPLLRRMINHLLHDGHGSASELVGAIAESAVADVEPQRDLSACYWGFCLVGFGTIIWGYGDLITCVIDMSLACLRELV